MLWTCEASLSAGLVKPSSGVPIVGSIPIHWFAELRQFIEQPGAAWQGSLNVDALVTSIVPVMAEKKLTGEFPQEATLASLNWNEHPKLTLNGLLLCYNTMKRAVLAIGAATGLRVYGFRPWTDNSEGKGLWRYAPSVFAGFGVDIYPYPRKVVEVPSGDGEAEYAWYVGYAQKRIQTCVGRGRPLLMWGSSVYFGTRTDTYDGDPVPDRMLRLQRVMSDPFGDFCLYTEARVQGTLDQHAQALQEVSDAGSTPAPTDQ